MATIAEGLMAYRICAQAEGGSPKTILRITSSVTYFGEFLGSDRQDIDGITGNDLRQFIIALQQRPRYLNHPYKKQRPDKISAQSIEAYARAVRAFFGFLYREGMIARNRMQKVKMPKVPKVAVPTFRLSDKKRTADNLNKTTSSR